MRKLLAATSILALSTLSTVAGATTFTYDHITIPPLFVDVRVGNAPPGAPKTIGDGMIILQRGSHEDGDYEQLLALCIDPLNPNFLTDSGSYIFGPQPAAFSHVLDGEIGALLQYAVDNYQSNPLIAAAAQLDIWRDIYPKVLFIPEIASIDIEAAAIDALNLRPDFLWFALTDSNGIGQRLATPGTPVSEPATLALLGVALLSFGMYRYRARRSQDTGESHSQQAAISI